MNAYNELYLDDAMANLGDMVEYAVCTLGYAPDDFFGWFISSGIASKFENGNPKYVAGMSGVELADAVLAAVNMQSERRHQPYLSSKGREYWAGWILAYYQWETNRRFSDMVEYGWHGIWMAVFHSISAFCNAGFDILGTNNNLYPSLTGYVQNPVINITIMLLIITGGIGFLTWDDICENKLHFHRYRMQSKVILVTTLALIVLPALFFFFVDFDALPLRERVQAALFQSVTPRTAGFNTVDLPAMSGASLGVMILLMLIGGSPGSTAGGMKTTTLAVLLANAAASFRQRDSAQFFGRRVDCSAVKTAATILTMYLALFFGGAVFISVYENLPLSPCLYETASAVGTVGLTLGITPQLHIPSQAVLIALMYLGRVGGLTLIYAAVSSKKSGNAKLPQERITIG